MSAEHTPGPWEAETEQSGDLMFRPWVGRLDESRYAALSCGQSRREAEANARLIAAAPDLLEACERIRDEKAPSYHDCIDNGEPECAWCAVFNAIAKARGAA